MNLAELLRWRSDGRSYEQLGEACAGRPSAKRLRQIATAPLAGFPDPDSIRNLARGLRVSEAHVVLAAAESLGLDTPRALSAMMGLMAGETRRLSDRQASAISEVLRAFEDEAGAVKGTPESGAVVPGSTPESAQQMRDVETLHGADAQPPREEESSLDAGRRTERNRSQERRNQ